MNDSLLNKIKNNESINTDDAVSEWHCLHVSNAGTQYNELLSNIKYESKINKK